jgi:hypothetical protein
LLTPKLGLDANNVVGTGQCFTPGGKVRIELKDNQGLIKKHMYVTATPAWKCDFPDQCVPTFDGGKISYDFGGAYLPVTNWLYCLAPASGSHLEVIARDESSGKVVSLEAC